ncbi:MAG: NlpC/P60 family protein [Ilumatobacteraceae bacterium]
MLVTGGFAAVPMSVGTAAAKSPVIHDDPLAPVAQRALNTLVQLDASGTQATWRSYEADRHTIATTVAERLALDATALEAAWRSADIAHQEALMAAFSQLGVPYRTNRSEPGVGFDCSGLTTYAWAQAGVTLPRQSGSQINTIAKRTAETAQAGDIAYYPGHAMMWLGVDTAIVHAPYTGRTVEVDFATKKHSLRFGNPLG